MKMAGLPEIPQVRQNLVDSSLRRNATHNSVQSEESGSDKRSSRSSTAGTERGERSSSPKLGGALLSPSPPPGHPSLLTRPKTSLSITRRPLDYVCVSRSELERTDQVLTALRSEAIHLQAQLRELQHYRLDFTKLQSACDAVGKALGSSVEGCPASMVQDIIPSRVHSLLQECKKSTQEKETCQTKLERCQEELASTVVHLSQVDNKLEQARSREMILESDLSQAKSKVEQLQLACARSGASLVSLRHQLVQMKEQAESNTKETSSELTHWSSLSTLEKRLTEKDDDVWKLKLKLKTAEADREKLSERLENSLTMYMDLGLQLAQALQVETDGFFDSEHLLAQVSGVIGEKEGLRLSCERLKSSMRTAELDSKASRETILRLVSDGKKQFKDAEELAKTRVELDEHKELVVAAEKERGGLQERLAAAKTTIVALEQELQAKQGRVADLCRSLDMSKLSCNTSKSMTESVQVEHKELLWSLGELLSVHSSEPAILLAGRKLVKNCAQQSDQLAEQSCVLQERDKQIQILRNSFSQLQQELQCKQEKVGKLEGELDAAELVQSALRKDLDKSRIFCKMVGRVVGLERETEVILAAGDFAHDAILMKAEQLAKHESEALVNKQTAVYSLQRKLKACRQCVDSKTLQLGLLQRKLQGVDEQVHCAKQKEVECQAATSKMRNMERQLDHVQGKMAQQRDLISQLENDSSQLHSLKDYSQQLEQERASLLANKEELELMLSRQSQQLSEARQKVREKKTQPCKQLEELRTELGSSQREKDRLKGEEVKLSSFRSAVEKLLMNHDRSLGKSKGAPTDCELMMSLEILIASQQRHDSNTKCVEASLRQLELGFKTNYKDTLTLLGSD